MIPLRSRSDSFTFTPELSAIASGSNFSRCPLVIIALLMIISAALATMGHVTVTQRRVERLRGFFLSCGFQICA